MKHQWSPRHSFYISTKCMSSDDTYTLWHRRFVRPNKASFSSFSSLFNQIHCTVLTKGTYIQQNVRTLHQYVPPSSKFFIRSLEVSAIVLSAIHKFECLNHKTKCAICKLCRLSVTKNYFYNVSPQTSSLLLLLRSGDVSTNPGLPESKRKYTPKNPCSRCGKGVTARNRAVSRDSCGQWTHNRCASVFSSETYDELCNSGDHFNI